MGTPIEINADNVRELGLKGKLIFIEGTDSPVTVLDVVTYNNPEPKLVQHQLFLGRKNPDANDKTDPALGVSIWITAFNNLPVFYVGKLKEGEVFDIDGVASIACTAGNILTSINRQNFISAKAKFQTLMNNGGARNFVLYDIMHKRTYFLNKETQVVDAINADGQYGRISTSRYVLNSVRGNLKCVVSSGLDFSRYLVLPVEVITAVRTVYYKGEIYEVRGLFSPFEFWGYLGGKRSNVFIPLEVAIGQ